MFWVGWGGTEIVKRPISVQTIAFVFEKIK